MLGSIETRLETTLGLLARIPPERIVITGSGVLASSDVSRLPARGVNALLVGEPFMHAPKLGEALRQLYFVDQGA